MAAGNRGREGRQVQEMPPILGRPRCAQNREQAGNVVLIHRMGAVRGLKKIN
jgi:hypothetical protein